MCYISQGYLLTFKKDVLRLTPYHGWLTYRYPACFAVKSFLLSKEFVGLCHCIKFATIQMEVSYLIPDNMKKKPVLYCTAFSFSLFANAGSYCHFVYFYPVTIGENFISHPILRTAYIFLGLTSKRGSIPYWVFLDTQWRFQEYHTCRIHSVCLELRSEALGFAFGIGVYLTE